MWRIRTNEGKETLVIADAKDWLAEYYDIGRQDVDNILKDEKATSYLLVWSIFEQDIFKGFMKACDIITVSKTFERWYSDLDVDDIAKSFHSRYQNNDNYRHLFHDADNGNFKEIINKSFTDLSGDEKLIMLFFVSYRYRNNIFHGNKKVLAWTRYTKQIEDCLYFMTNIIDLNKKENIIGNRLGC